MKKTLWLTAALLTLGIGVASAQLNLNWQDCTAGSGFANRTFGCASNAGSNVLISSFIAPANVTAATGGDIVMDMQSAGATLSNWWNFGGCRSGGALLFSTDFSGVPNGGCDDLFGPALGGGFNFPGFGGANRQRFKHGFARVSGFPAMTAGNEVYFSRIVITNAGTVGGCSGCATGACIVLNQINVTQDPVLHPGGNFFFTAPATRQHVTWQGGGGVACPDVTPAKKTSWGAIKTLYR